MKKLQPEISEGQFRLKDILYNVTETYLSASCQDMEIILFPEVSAETEDDKVEYEMSKVHLYHNNGFNTHTSTFKDLKGKKFIWTSEYNAEDEEAGTFCVQEHEYVRKGTIEILDADDGQLTIRWSGKADVGWGRKYGENVPFETIFSVKIPESMPYRLDAFKSTKMKIDEDTQLEILNLEEFNCEVDRVSSTRQWEDFNTVLKLKLTHKDADYFGEVYFTNGKNNHQLKMDGDCPIKLGFGGVDYNLKVNYEIFSFEME